MSLETSLTFEVYQEHQSSLINELFAASFGHALADELWAWKVNSMHSIGLCTFHDQRLIAFYGGMPRRFQFGKQFFTLLQIHDVMVLPKMQGLLRRRGLFVLTAEQFLDTFVNGNHDFVSAFGFPNERALRIGKLSGLYQPIDKIYEHQWPVLKRFSWRKAQLLKTEDFSSGKIKHRYQISLDKMSRALTGFVWGDRDWDYLQRRYIEHPIFDYAVIICSHFGMSDVFCVVKKHDENTLELMDLIGNPKYYSAAIQALLNWATTQNYQTLTGWFSQSMEHYIHTNHRTCLICEVPKPQKHGMTWTPNMEGKLWLMSGDTDFK